MIPQKKYQFWFCTGSQDLYGDECLANVAEHSRIIVNALNASGELPYEVVWKPTLITNELIRRTFNEANTDENCASDEVLDEESIYFDSKDEGYKSVYGAIASGEKVTFSIDTGDDAQQVTLVIKGKEKQILKMTKAEGAEEGKARWSVETSFVDYGEYQYYFVIGGESSVKIYSDDDGYYGTGMTAELTEVNAHSVFSVRSIAVSHPL